MSFDIAAVDLTSSTLNIYLGNINKAGQIHTKANMAIECDGIKRGIVEDMDSLSDSLLLALKRIKAKHGIDIKSAFINVPCYMCKNYHNSIKEDVTHKEKIDKECIQTVKNKLLNINKPDDFVIIDVAGSKFILDGNMQVRDPYGMNAKSLLAMSNVIAVKNEYFNILTKVFENIDLKIDGIIMNTLSGLSMLPFSDSERSNIIIINISWEITDITVCKCGKITYMDSIPAGAKNIIKDVSIGLNISFEQAKKMLDGYSIADTQYIKNDFETVLKDVDGKETKFLLSDMIKFVKDRINDIYSICLDKLEKNGMDEDYSICIYGADIEKYSGYLEHARAIFNMETKRIPYALFEVDKIKYGPCAGMIRYISHHPLLKKQSDIIFKNTKKNTGKKNRLKKIFQFLKFN